MKWNTWFAIAIIALLVAGCVSASEELLCASKWRMTQFEGEGYSHLELESHRMMNGRIAFTFAPNHTFIQWDEATKVMEGKWEVKGGKLKLTANDSTIQYPVYHIEKLTAMELMLKSTDEKGRAVTVGYLSIPN